LGENGGGFWGCEGPNGWLKNLNWANFLKRGFGKKGGGTRGCFPAEKYGPLVWFLLRGFFPPRVCDEDKHTPSRRCALPCGEQNTRTAARLGLLCGEAQLVHTIPSPHILSLVPRRRTPFTPRGLC